MNNFVNLESSQLPIGLMFTLPFTSIEYHTTDTTSYIFHTKSSIESQATVATSFHLADAP